jgi:hypothetical protein
MSDIEGLVRALKGLAGANVSQLTPQLQRHFEGTCERLRSWNAPEWLCHAGLYHAVYGTYGFHPQLVEPGRRQEVAEVIGAQSEEMAYFYSACDRAWFWPRLARDEFPEYRDRFTGAKHVPPREVVANFCQLSAANEIDVLVQNREEYLAEYGCYVLPLFTSPRFLSYLSEQGAAECREYFTT